MKMLLLTLKKSLIGRLERHKATVAALGLRRLHQTVRVAATPENLGRIKLVDYLLQVEEDA